MKILTWNVNGLRAREKAGMINTINKIQPDILCLQETRCNYDQMKKETFDYFMKIPNFCTLTCHQKKGYAGVLTNINTTKTGFPCGGTPSFYNYYTELHEDGRQYITALENCVIINVYSPNSGRDLEKLEHRVEWEDSLLQFVERTEEPIILCGDMNVAPDRIDCNVFSKAGTSVEERECFRRLKERGNLVDVYRELNPMKQEFTWHSNCYDSFSTNKGMRIDHFLISRCLLNRVKGLEIINDPILIAGSDHCPVVLDIDLNYDFIDGEIRERG